MYPSWPLNHSCSDLFCINVVIAFVVMLLLVRVDFFFHSFQAVGYKALTSEWWKVMVGWHIPILQVMLWWYCPTHLLLTWAALVQMQTQHPLFCASLSCICLILASMISCSVWFTPTAFLSVGCFTSKQIMNHTGKIVFSTRRAFSCPYLLFKGPLVAYRSFQTTSDTFSSRQSLGVWGSCFFTPCKFFNLT